MCCEADWKREQVPDHKWDFINVREFHRDDFFTRVKYVFVYIFLLKSVAVYGLDIFTAVTMLSTNHWTNAIYSKCGDDCVVKIGFDVAKWIFVGCIIFSFLLLGYETWKARNVILSRDISYAFTNLIANDYFSLRWKRLLLADGARQSINALTLYSFAYANNFQTEDIPAYWDNDLITAMLLFSMIFTVVIFLGSLILLIAAAIGYVPLLCYIQGNLKEYVCHKVDKRISELIKRKMKQRIAKNAALEKKLALGGELTNAKGEVIKGVDILQPTLPQVAFDDGDDDMAMNGKRSRSQKSFGRNKKEWENYPSSPAHNQYPPGAYGQPYDDGYGSSTNLTSAAAPLGISYPPPTSLIPPSQFQQQQQPYSSPYQPPLPSSRSQPDVYLNHQRPVYNRQPTDMYEYDQSSPSYHSHERHSGLAYDEPTQDYDYQAQEQWAAAQGRGYQGQSQNGQGQGWDQRR